MGKLPLHQEADKRIAVTKKTENAAGEHQNRMHRERKRAAKS